MPGSPKADSVLLVLVFGMPMPPPLIDRREARGTLPRRVAAPLASGWRGEGGRDALAVNLPAVDGVRRRYCQVFLSPERVARKAEANASVRLSSAPCLAVCPWAGTIRIPGNGLRQSEPVQLPARQK